MSSYLATYHIDNWEVLARLLLAAALGFAVGFDRSIKNKPLGFRPFMLVSLGSCLFAVTILELTAGALPADIADRVDVSRVYQGLIGGIGFLGAGAIIQSRSGGVRGSATGAGIWLVGGIGLSVGFGLYFIAIAASVIAVIVFVLFGLLREEVDEKTEDLNDKK
ncbi:MAG: MgtC/SapB family protein [Alphaproteobacteria bacterium]|nr:MgtC/SapB family protein [Alphaproteobacteria bacterium]